MKMNRKNLKLTPIRLMAGAGLIMASFLSEASAAVFDCTRLHKCNRNWEKCKTDDYFKECKASCPIKNGNDPIEKCSKAHEEATRVKLIKKGENVKVGVPNVKVDVPCEEVKRLIDTHGKLARETGISDYSWKEIKYLVNNCSTVTESPAGGKTPPVKFEDDLSAAVKNRQLKPVGKSKVEPNPSDAKHAADTPSSELAQVLQKRMAASEPDAISSPDQGKPHESLSKEAQLEKPK